MCIAHVLQSSRACRWQGMKLPAFRKLTRVSETSAYIELDDSDHTGRTKAVCHWHDDNGSRSAMIALGRKDEPQP